MNKLQYIKNAKIELKEKGYRFTYPRSEILNLVYDSKKYMNVYEIYEKLKKKSIGISTVYRNVLMLENIGILRKIYISNVGYYELESARKYKINIRTKCIKCNKITDLDDKYVEDNLNNFVKNLEKNKCISVKGISVILSVLCDECKV